MMYGEKFYQLHGAQQQLLRPLNNLKKKRTLVRLTTDTTLGPIPLIYG